MKSFIFPAITKFILRISIILKTYLSEFINILSENQHHKLNFYLQSQQINFKKSNKESKTIQKNNNSDFNDWDYNEIAIVVFCFQSGN